MEATPHPEALAGKPAPITRFTFDSRQVAEARAENEKFLTRWKGKLEDLDAEATIGEHRVVASLVHHAKNPAELRAVGKALIQAAEMKELLQTLEDRAACLKVATKEPEWLALAFGDHNDEMTDAIERILSSGR